jgi:hypothetical protein
MSSGRIREVPPVICVDDSTRVTPKVEKKGAYLALSCRMAAACHDQGGAI